MTPPHYAPYLAGELPFELTAGIAGVMLVRAVRPDSRGSKWLAVLGILVNIGLAGYEIVSSLRVGGKLIAPITHHG